MSQENGSEMFDVYLIDGDKVMKNGGVYYYWIRENVFFQDPKNSILFKIQPFNETVAGWWRDRFNNSPPYFNV